jgi:DNA-binding winged helix-turn-helix (wHTH) protein/tetratricopeptide (TPR) repeat protein
MKPEEIFQFGDFQIDVAGRTLRREDEAVVLNRRAFDVLLYLVQNPGRILTHDELLKNVWPDSFVDENSLAQSISALRRALGEKPGDNSYIVTLPGRGYQFVLPVRAIAPKSLSALPQAGIADGDAPGQLFLQQHTVRSSFTIEKEEQLRRPRFRSWWAIVGPGALLLVVVALAAVGYVAHHRAAHRLTEKDTVVLADFANSTNDPVFDDTLKTALSVALNQSPFLNVLSDRKVAKTLRLMSRSADTKLTPDVAREVCQRSGSKAFIAGSIANLGAQYVVVVEAADCESGDTLAQVQATASSKEKVLDALTRIASKVRAQLGESLTTVTQYDVPLAQATTPSLEALKAFSLASKAMRGKDPAAALPYAQHAIELDPEFAMAYVQLGATYYTLNEVGHANEYYAKAFELRERASEGEKLAITATYYGFVSGQLDKAAQTFEELTEIHPRDIHAYNGLALIYEQLGQYDKSAEATRTLIQLDPDYVFAYTNLSMAEMALQHFEEAQQIIGQAHTRKLDDYLLRTHLYTLAFLHADSDGMGKQQQWLRGQPLYENYGLALASDTEAYAGHVRKSQELTREAVDSAMRAENREGAALYQANFGVQQAAYGNASVAMQAAAEASRAAPDSRGVEAEAALAYAMADDKARAESLAKDLNRRFPLDTQMQSLWLPAIQAQLALSRRNLGLFADVLQAVSPVEYGNISFTNNTSCLYLTYVRGEAYLSTGNGTAAASEFQKIIDHNGIVWNCWTGALAHLGLARANALESRTSPGSDSAAAHVRAVAAYKDFLALWKDADPDIPILKQAQAEYAKLTAERH